MAPALAGLLAIVLLPAVGAGGGWDIRGGAVGPGFCVADPDPPEYYRIPLVSTRMVSGTGQTRGEAGLVFPADTPFGVSLTPDGSYDYRVRFQVERLPARANGVFVAWVTTPEVDRVRRIGPLDAEGRAEGAVEWNKFLVVVTLEPEGGPTAAPAGGDGARGDGAGGGAAAMDAPGGVAGPAPPWAGPVILRGMSRSGRMHTMAGHGPFEQERCAKYGY